MCHGELESASLLQQERPKSFRGHVFEDCKQSRFVAVTQVEESDAAQESANIMSNLLDLCNELWFDIKSDWRGHVLVHELVAITDRIFCTGLHTGGSDSHRGQQ